MRSCTGNGRTRRAWGRGGGLVSVVALLLAAQGFGLGLTVWRGRIATWVGSRVVGDIRTSLWRGLQRRSLSYFDRAQVGEITNRVNADVGRMQEFLTDGAQYFIGQVVQLAFAVIMMFCINWRMVLVAVLPGRLLLVVFYVYPRSCSTSYDQPFGRERLQQGRLTGKIVLLVVAGDPCIEQCGAGRRCFAWRQALEFGQIIAAKASRRPLYLDLADFLPSPQSRRVSGCTPNSRADLPILTFIDQAYAFCPISRAMRMLLRAVSTPGRGASRSGRPDREVGSHRQRKRRSAPGRAGRLAQMPGPRAEPPRETEVAPEDALRQVWGALRDHYPMLEYAGAVGDAWLEEFLPRARAAGSPERVFPLLRELVGRLRDYHTRIEWPGLAIPEETRPDLTLAWVDEGLAVAQADVDLGLPPGERVLAVDGLDTPRALARAWAESQGATPEARRRNACARLTQGAPGSVLRLRTESGEVEIARPERRGDRIAAEPDPARIIGLDSLGDDAGILRIRAWGGGLGAEVFTARLDAELERARDLPHLVVDVRGNGGGLDSLADACTGRFIARPVVSSISFLRQPGTTMFERTVELCRPRGSWRYGGRVAVLIDPGCASACEHFVSGMDASGHACLVGLPTTGACGWSRRIPLPCGAVLFCSMTFPLHGSVPSPLHGIEPHFRVPLTLADLRGGRDAPLEVALAWLRSGRPLPESRNCPA